MNSTVAALTTGDFSEILSFTRITARPPADMSLPRLLELLATCFGAHSVCSCTRSLGKVNVSFHGVSADYERTFRQKYYPRNPLSEWPESAEARRASIVANPTFVDQSGYRGSEFYRQFTDPLGMHQSLIVLLRSRLFLRVIGIWRPEGAPAFGLREQTKAELLLPALRTAIDELDPVGLLSDFGAAVETLDPFFDKDGVVVSTELRPLYSNSVAGDLLASLHTADDADDPRLALSLPKLLRDALQFRQTQLASIGNAFPRASEFSMRAPRSPVDIIVQVVPLHKETACVGFVLRLKHTQLCGQMRKD
jgi:hypothetical protein